LDIFDHPAVGFETPTAGARADIGRHEATADSTKIFVGAQCFFEP